VGAVIGTDDWGVKTQTMLARAATGGSCALGTGNSVPAYVPDDHYFAMIRACLDARQANA